MKARVLVVDDDPALAEMLTIVLRGEGFDTDVVADGSRAPAGHPAHPAGVRPARGAGPQTAPGVHPRGAARTGLGLPARGRHAPGQRACAATAVEGREGPGAPRGGADRARCRVQGWSAVSTTMK